MVTMYRKNHDWQPIYITIETDKLETLGDIIGEKVRADLTPAQKKKKWVAIDIVDTIVVTSGFNPKTSKSILELLVYVADMTGKYVD